MSAAITPAAGPCSYYKIKELYKSACVKVSFYIAVNLVHTGYLFYF
jgi:hypothetical protein